MGIYSCIENKLVKNSTKKMEEHNEKKEKKY